MGLSLGDFSGVWRLDRRITDHLTGQGARFIGAATLHPPENGAALWAERGEMRIADAAPMQAERRYRWAQNGAMIDVFFEDGRAFHSFDPNGAPKANHWCDPDDYRVSYDFTQWPNWRAVWRVKGPRKDYEMTTAATRP